MSGIDVREFDMLGQEKASKIDEHQDVSLSRKERSDQKLMLGQKNSENKLTLDQINCLT